MKSKAGPNSEQVRAVVETPKGSRNKFDWSPEAGAFLLSKVLPAGAVFPFDFGFIPGTLAPDGDPLDVLIFMDSPAFPGCRVEIRLIEVIEATQGKQGQHPIRNDRLLAVAVQSNDHRDISSVDDLNGSLLDEVEEFFVDYNANEGRTFKPLGRRGPKRARKLLGKARR